MIIKVNKKTSRIEGYTNDCIGKLSKHNDYDLYEVKDIPNEYIFYKYINNEYIYDEEYKNEVILEDKKKEIRNQREIECFSIINRGYLWYFTLTSSQINELLKWYQEWLDAPNTLIIPEKLEWLK